MSAGELSHWEMRYYGGEFLGSEREDYRFARLEAAIVTWAGRSLREGADPPSPLDLMPWRERPEPEDPVDLDAFRLRCALAARQGQEQGATLRDRILREQAAAAGVDKA